MLNLLLPHITGVQLDDVITDEERIHVSMTSTHPQVACPLCLQASSRVHSRYERCVSDLPWAGLCVRLSLCVRRFFCDNAACARRIFCERLGPSIPMYARRTSRLITALTHLALLVGGEVGARVMRYFGILVSPDTLLRLIRRSSEPDIPTPRILGVDDWARCKGRSYGTILIDLEHHEAVDVLPESTSEALSDWLQAHPGVEIISRDRSTVYIEGAHEGAPEAIQVADRFHLLQNMLDVLKRLMERHAHVLKEATKQQATAKDQGAEQNAMPAIGADRPPSVRQIRFEAVKTLQKQGKTQRSIASQLQMNRRTVRRYMDLDALPDRFRGALTTSKATPYLSYLRQRIQDGVHNCRQLFDEIRHRGFIGSYSSLWRTVGYFLPRRKDKRSSKPASPHPPVLSPRQAAWLLLQPSEELEPDQQIIQTILCTLSETARKASDLAHSFAQMIREHQADQLDSWLTEAQESAISEFRHFAIGLKRDYDAVKAALMLPWSNGQTEGQVHRLKLIKRQMYGRANFDLLRKRVLYES
jgi:transposase